MTDVLVVEDDLRLSRTLVITLRARGYVARSASTTTQALALVGESLPEVVILDLGLPDGDGVDLITDLRRWTQVPILVLSARSDSADKIDALDAGADDYVTKPFEIDELLARLRAMTRRVPTASDEPVVTVGDLTVDLAMRRVSNGEEDIHLTPTEWHLLEVMVRHPGTLLSQRRLLAEVWGPGYESARGNLRLYMAQLRKKIEPDPARPQHLLNEPGLGYRFEP